MLIDFPEQYIGNFYDTIANNWEYQFTAALRKGEMPSQDVLCSIPTDLEKITETANQAKDILHKHHTQFDLAMDAIDAKEYFLSPTVEKIVMNRVIAKVRQMRTSGKQHDTPYAEFQTALRPILETFDHPVLMPEFRKLSSNPEFVDEDIGNLNNPRTGESIDMRYSSFLTGSLTDYIIHLYVGNYLYNKK